MRNVDLAIIKAGGRAALARHLGVTRQAVHNWVSRGFIPPDRAIAVEKAFGVPAAGLVSPKMRRLLTSMQRAL